MRLFFSLIIMILWLAPADAAGLPQDIARPGEVGLRSLKSYRAKPEPQTVPPMIRALSQQGSFKDPEASGVYVGFLAGVLSANPRNAKSLLLQILPLPFEDQWLPIKAVAYSGLPHWRDLLRELGTRLPDRQVLIDRYLSGAFPTLNEAKLEPTKPSTMDKVRRVFKYETYFGPKQERERPRELTFATNPDLIDIYWGVYFATGREEPIARIITLLPWSKDRDSVEKLSTGSMAKLTLAANAAYDLKLLGTIKRLAPHQTKTVQPFVKEVIEAAETSDTGRIKREAVAALEELRRKGPGSKRDIAWWGKIGETAISMGCIGAAVTGQVQFGVPCVVGGALSTATIRYFSSPE